MSAKPAASPLSGFVEELDLHVRARYPLLYLATWEEHRLDEVLARLADSHGKSLVTWSITQGLRWRDARGGAPVEGPKDPAEALAAVDRAGPPSTTDGVAERFGQPEMPSDPAEAAPLNCGKCGGDNPARSETCFNCGAELDTPEMRAHQDEYRVRHVAAQQKALAMREARRHEVEAKALHELERRRSAASQPGEPTWGQSNDA